MNPAGDEGFAPSALEAHRPWLYRLAMAILRDPVQADDCVQDVLLAALRSRHERWPDEASRRAWFRRVLVNRIRKLGDRDALRRYHERRALEEHGRFPLPPLLERQELGAELAQCLAALKPRVRDALLLRHVLDMYPAEISARLCVPIKTVNSWLHRAYSKLRLRLNRR